MKINNKFDPKSDTIADVRLTYFEMFSWQETLYINPKMENRH